MSTTVRKLPDSIPALLEIDRVGDQDHFVQFYKDEQTLVDCIARYFAVGFAKGKAALFIGTPQRREAVQAKLIGLDVDVSALRESRAFSVFDAREMLLKFMVSGHPDRRRFRALLGSAMDVAFGRCNGVRAYGEMVALLLADGNEAGALELEHLWNELGETHEFGLFCAYPAEQFLGGKSNCLSNVCRAHSRVISG